MIQLKPKVNKSKIIRELQKYADDTYEMAWESEYAKLQFMDGAKKLFELLQLPK